MLSATSEITTRGARTCSRKGHPQREAAPSTTIRRRCARCLRPAPPLDSPHALQWQLIAEDGEVTGVICPGCLTLSEERTIRREQARIVRRLKRGLPPTPGPRLAFGCALQARGRRFEPGNRPTGQMPRSRELFGSLGARPTTAVIGQNSGPRTLRLNVGTPEDLTFIRARLDAGQSDRHWNNQGRAGVPRHDLTVPHEIASPNCAGSSPPRPP